MLVAAPHIVLFRNLRYPIFAEVSRPPIGAHQAALAAQRADRTSSALGITRTARINGVP